MARLTEQRLWKVRGSPDEGRPRGRDAEPLRDEGGHPPGRRVRARLHEGRQFPLHSDGHDEEQRLRARSRRELRLTRSLRAGLAVHFVESFPQVAWAETSIEQTLWERIRVDGAPHPHAFAGYGSGRRTSFVKAERGPASPARRAPLVRGGLSGLEVIKTSGSRFSGFLVDRLTTLRETEDRILATNIDAVWDFAGGQVDYNGVFETARRIIPRTFALHDSHSVQETIFAMGEALLAEIARDLLRQLQSSQPPPHRGEPREPSA